MDLGWWQGFASGLLLAYVAHLASDQWKAVRFGRWLRDQEAKVVRPAPDPSDWWKGEN